MKKILFLFALIAACTFPTVAADWGLGIGIAVPDYNFEANDTDIDMNAVDFELAFLRISDTLGITMKFGLDMGVAWSDDVVEKDTSVGFDLRSDFGLGITPIRARHLWLTLLGTVGFGWDFFAEEGTWTDNSQQGTYKVRRCEYKNQWNYVQAHVGIEATAQLKLTDSFGFYTTIGVQKLFAGKAGWRVDETRYSGYYYDAYKSTYSDYDGDSMSGTIKPLFVAGIMMYF
ncbi:MAG: hypothetical protein IJ558_00415 [Treponema sp.]|nr:hypothetical protein [Treponema sp.]